MSGRRNARRVVRTLCGRRAAALALAVALPGGGCSPVADPRGTPAASVDVGTAPALDARRPPAPASADAADASGGAVDATTASGDTVPVAAPDAAVDAAPIDAPVAETGADARVTQDARVATDAPPTPPSSGDGGACLGPPPDQREPAGTCGFSACGGDPVGEWALVAWCEGSYAPARGRLTMRADRTFAFVLDYTGANTKVKCLAPQTGTWETMKNEIIFRRASSGPAFAYSGAVARGAEWYPYCVQGDSFKYVADHTRPRWVYVRRR